MTDEEQDIRSITVTAPGKGESQVRLTDRRVSTRFDGGWLGTETTFIPLEANHLRNGLMGAQSRVAVPFHHRRRGGIPVSGRYPELPNLRVGHCGSPSTHLHLLQGGQGLDLLRGEACRGDARVHR